MKNASLTRSRLTFNNIVYVFNIEDLSAEVNIDLILTY
jgi:hypothetical protein